MLIPSLCFARRLEAPSEATEKEGEDMSSTVPEKRRTPPLMRLLQASAVFLVFGLLALLIWKVIHSGSGAAFVKDVAAGKKPSAPAFSLSVIWPAGETWPPSKRTRLADGRLGVNELRGYPVVLNFWASWCIPCKEEAPLFAEAARRYRGKVMLLGIDVQDLDSDAHRFLRRYHVNYVSLKDKGSSTFDAYGLTGVPETYYLDRGGRVLFHSLGPVTKRDLRQAIVALAQSAGR